LCVEGYYHDLIFHTQVGDPTRTGEGGKIYGEPFKDEFRTRIRSCGRGLIAVANAGKDDNTSQFLFILGSTSELQSKHTIFDKVTGETIYNMLKLEKAPVDEDDKSLYPPRLLKSIILNNPFADIIPRIIVLENEEVKDSSKTEAVAVKDFNLLSFGEEAEEDNEESVILSKKFNGKENSAHDHLTDPKLSPQPAVEPPKLAIKKRKENRSIRFRLRSCGRCLIAMANAGEDNHGSQFFVTLGSQLDLQNKHSTSGYVSEETIYDMLELEEALVDENDKPLYAPKMIKAELLNNPFSDIIPRIYRKVKNNFNLLSFGEKAEEDEEESAILNRKSSGKSKSAHDHLTDPKLSS
ncbi:Peptidyl-prolyl cis-trans isomerase CWC27 like protein, partial [Eufriesea mexicana]